MPYIVKTTYILLNYLSNKVQTEPYLVQKSKSVCGSKGSRLFQLDSGKGFFFLSNLVRILSPVNPS